MSSREGHENRYEHNKAFLKTIDSSQFCDWAITVCFYCSLHKVSQCLHYVYGATDSDISTHERTKIFLKDKNIPLFNDYARLYSLSRTARYDCIDVSQKVNNANDLLQKIENQSATLMAEKARSLFK